MGKEIERKFLLKNENWRKLVSEEIVMKQGYLNTDPERTVRIRLAKNKGVLTIKSKAIGITRKEFEYDVPLGEANELIELCDGPIIEKVRHLVIVNNQTWEIDEFKDRNEGLIVAEIELETETSTVNLPEWIGLEVSGDPRYYNSNLIKNPIKV